MPLNSLSCVALQVASFETAVTTWGRGDFTRVSRLLGTKSTSEVVSRYYNTWKRNSASYTAFRAAHPMKDVERRGAHDADRMGRSWFHLWKMPAPDETLADAAKKSEVEEVFTSPAISKSSKPVVDNEPYCCLCGDGGDIILCEGDCRRYPHYACVHTLSLSITACV